jgi:TfoX/Sxy family transcriptional regulator of competence genes
MPAKRVKPAKSAKSAKSASREMPAFTKAPPEVIATFQSAVDGLDGVERRTMFGYPAAFAKGNMFACVFQDRIMVRLAPDDRAEAMRLDGAKMFEPMPGRPMREYVELPADVMRAPPVLRGWVSRGRDYAAGLPTKKPAAKSAARKRDA